MSRTRRGFLWYGPAPAAIALLALLAGGGLLWSGVGGGGRATPRADLVLVTFAREHVESLTKAADQFHARTGKRVEIQLTDSRALNSRLLASMRAGADVPDLVEVVEPTMGLYTRGPLEEVGFLDLTDRLAAEGWNDRLVNARYSLWASRGRVFALPHDVHPVMLAYRRDLLEAEGIDPASLTTWAEFFRVGRAITEKYRRPDGNSERYMLDMPVGGGSFYQSMILQADGGMFDERGEVAFDSEIVARVTAEYVRAVSDPPTGPKTRLSFDAGWGQNLSKSMIDGLVLFVLAPDWRTRSFTMDVPGLSGKMALMPLPAWQPGGRRTSVWGGTGLAIPKAGKNPDLAWQFATFAYYDPAFQDERFEANNILPPIKDAWASSVMDRPDPMYSNQPRGRLYADLAPQTPPRYVTAYTALAESKCQEALVNAIAFYQTNGEAGLDAFIRAELKRAADQVRVQKNRNVFLSPKKEVTP